MHNKNDLNTTPIADQGAWTVVFEDLFNGTALDRGKWPILYGGSTYWNGAFSWDHRDVAVGGGELTVSATKRGNTWTAGGLSSIRWDLDRGDGFDFTYGRIEVHAAIDAGKGTGPAILLWPFDNRWPPEIDLVETPDGQRRSVWFTNHWPGLDGGDQYHSVEIKSIDGTPFDALGTTYDGRTWHTYTLDWLPVPGDKLPGNNWLPGKLRYYIDGVKLYETPDGEDVSGMPMGLGLQMFVAASNDGWYGGGPDRTTPRQVKLHIDYLRVYESDATRVEQERGTAPPPQQATARSSLAPAEAGGTLLVREAEAAEDGGPPGLGVARAVRAERVAGTPADDVLAGGADADLFIPGPGRDRVRDFHPGTDRLLLEGVPEQVRTFFVEEDGVEVLMVMHGTGPNLVALPGVVALGLGDLVFA